MEMQTQIHPLPRPLPEYREREFRERAIRAPEALVWAVGCSMFFFLVYGGTNWVASMHGELPST